MFEVSDSQLFQSRINVLIFSSYHRQVICSWNQRTKSTSRRESIWTCYCFPAAVEPAHRLHRSALYPSNNWVWRRRLWRSRNPNFTKTFTGAYFTVLLHIKIKFKWKSSRINNDCKYFATFGSTSYWVDLFERDSRRQLELIMQPRGRVTRQKPCFIAADLNYRKKFDQGAPLQLFINRIIVPGTVKSQLAQTRYSTLFALISNHR